MATFEFDDPTLAHLGVDPSVVEGVSPHDEASRWLSAFTATDDVLALFHPHGFWKDILALTWDLRTLRDRPAIRRVLDTAPGLSACRLLEDAVRGPMLFRPLPDLVFVRFCFDFETAHGHGIAVAFLVPTPDRTWLAWSLLTRLGALKAHPEQVGVLRARPSEGDDDWEDRRRREVAFDACDPAVLVIGAGHCGLGVAARLGSLGVPTLVIDRHRRVGDNWRSRYKSLRLHDPVWLNQMPYLAYPTTWPVYCPASKMGDWLESYATALDLNVWVDSTVTSTHFDPETKSWKVVINRGGTARAMTVRHLVFATGFGGGSPNLPNIPGKESYRGSVLHSTQYTRAADHPAKKAIVVGAGTSAHDIAHDLSRHGCDVTLVQRSPIYVMSQQGLETSVRDRYNEHFPIEFADILSVALPFATLKCLLKASMEKLANGIDKNLLDNLAKVGFQTYLGPGGAGLLPLIFERGGGIYIDVGASQEIINGSIKVKGSPSVRRFTEGGIELEDGATLEGDLIVFATGYGDILSSIAQVCGRDVATKVGKVWGLDAEGELQGVWRRTGHPRLWIAMSNFGRSRLHSLHLALQIKAIELGIVDI